MQQLTPETNTREQCAAAVLEAALVVSRYVRAQMWHARPAELTMPQFRALAMVAADPAIGPSQLAEALMLSRPAISRLLDELAHKGLLERETDPVDRRRLVLRPTPEGRVCVDEYFTAARALIAERLGGLTSGEQAAVTRAMQWVAPCFAPAASASANGSAPAAAAATSPEAGEEGE